MMKSGWFTVGTVAFLSENERKDGKGSYLVVYVRFGSEKGEVRKAKVWSQNYRSESGKFEVLDVSGAWVSIELGSELTAYGTESVWKDAEGNERVSYVMVETAGLPVAEAVTV